ncbi:MAG: type IV toxin-antitoxin system AbiEi family antitoxin domain-containing protein [Elusimicrobia bacterium]|nr:type IV toxin-antitoxin system AbiEi family antitoxin domain-containing protein [Elusimicrobiota bacterium]
MAKEKSGIAMIRLLAEEGRRIFNVRQASAIASQAGISAKYTSRALHRLVGSGWVIPLRQGLYALGPALSGGAPIHDFEIGTALVRKGAISYWSALNHHGMTEQIPRRVFVMTPHTISIPSRSRGGHGGGDDGDGGRDGSGHDRDGDGHRHRSGNTGFVVQNTFYQFVKVKPEWFFGVESYWIGEARVSITDPERTLLAALRHPNYCGGWDEIFGIFQKHISEVNVGKMAGYALRLPVAIAKRLGWIMEKLSVPGATIEKLQSLPAKSYSLLNPSGGNQGAYDSRWRLRINVGWKEL